MTRRERKRPVSTLVRYCLHWAPFLAVLFSVLFVETWLQLQIFQNDYLTNHLTRHNRELRNEINDMRARQAELEGMRRLEDYAPTIGLVEPEHGQIHIIPVPGQPTPVPEDEPPMAYARNHHGSESASGASP